MPSSFHGLLKYGTTFKSKHEKKKHECEFCGASFTKTDNLSRHLKERCSNRMPPSPKLILRLSNHKIYEGFEGIPLIINTALKKLILSKKNQNNTKLRKRADGKTISCQQTVSASRNRQHPTDVLSEKIS